VRRSTLKVLNGIQRNLDVCDYLKCDYYLVRVDCRALTLDRGTERVVD